MKWMEKEAQEEKVIDSWKSAYYSMDASERKKIPKPIREYLDEIYYGKNYDELGLSE